MKKATREWVKYAEADWIAVGELGPRGSSVYGVVAFHCQQAAEKYLKGLLEELGQPIPKIHDLKRLFSLLLPHYSTMRPLRRGLYFLSNYAVEIRYPGEAPTKRQTAAAVRWAARVRTVCRGLLGLKS